MLRGASPPGLIARIIASVGHGVPVVPAGSDSQFPNGASSFIGQHSQWFAQPVSGPHHTGQPEVSLYREKRYRIANGVRNRTHCPYFALVQPPVNGPQGIPAYLGHGRCVNHAKRQAP